MLRPWMQIAFPGTSATAEEEAYNSRMSAVRVAVEWNYKDLKQMWSLNDFSRALKVRQSPIGLLYISSALLHNVKTCLEAGVKFRRNPSAHPPLSQSTLLHSKSCCCASCGARGERSRERRGASLRPPGATRGAGRTTPDSFEVLQTRQSS